MKDPIMQALQQIHNDDLEWSGTFVGLTPRIQRDSTMKWVEADRDIDKDKGIDAALVKLLQDRERFAIAHVLLTHRSKAEFSSDGSQWNGLHVTIESSGAVQYDERDMVTLHDTWQAKAK